MIYSAKSIVFMSLAFGAQKGATFGVKEVPMQATTAVPTKPSTGYEALENNFRCETDPNAYSLEPVNSANSNSECEEACSADASCTAIKTTTANGFYYCYKHMYTCNAAKWSKDATYEEAEQWFKKL